MLLSIDGVEVLRRIKGLVPAPRGELGGFDIEGASRSRKEDSSLRGNAVCEESERDKKVRNAPFEEDALEEAVPGRASGPDWNDSLFLMAMLLEAAERSIPPSFVLVLAPLPPCRSSVSSSEAQGAGESTLSLGPR